MKRRTIPDAEAPDLCPAATTDPDGPAATPHATLRNAPVRVRCRDLGEMEYASCWQLQQQLFDALAQRKRNAAGNRRASDAVIRAEEDAGTVLLVEHPPVYTLGKSGHAENLLIAREALAARGATFFHIDRGGDITFHGPGQLVCYPILDLERLGIGLRDYIGALEEAVIRTAARYGIRAGRIPGASGVWIGRGIRRDISTAPHRLPEIPAGDAGPLRKLCAIGVRSSRFVTMHGFALNVATDLRWFSLINPCGFADRGTTSLVRECGNNVDMDQVKGLVLKFLSEVLNVEIYK